MDDRYLCPVCGFPGLREAPWKNGTPSDEICPSCGTHFGYDDVAAGDLVRRELTYQDLRQAWQSTGCRWFSKGRPPPEGWDPQGQLEAIEQG